MLIFMLMEIGLLFDAWLAGSRVSRYVLYYFGVKVLVCVMHAVGMVLVAGGRYRLGGVLQMVAGVVHVPELVGLLGVMGGLAAYRYPDRQALVV
jgi:hypothetical protein